MGGIQSMSRSTYSRLLPKDSMDNTTYFSFYDVLEKIAIILGTFIFALLIDNYDAIRVVLLTRMFIPIAYHFRNEICSTFHVCFLCIRIVFH